jgi:hypothetical protein
MTEVMSKKFLSKAVAGRTAAAGRCSRRRRLPNLRLVALVVLLAALGTGMLVAAFTASPPRPPQPLAGASPAAPASGRAAQTPPGLTNSPAAVPVAPMARSEPVRVTISKIGVAAEVIPLGTDKDGSLEVPPLEKAYLAGWYRLGPTPGEIGNAVIVGHVSSHKTGPAVFFSLGDLRPGDTIAVTRKDKTVVQFTVDQVESYPKTTFPSTLVYGPTDKPGLRLVTCGGQFDQRTRSYLNNIVVFATLTS